MANKEKIKIMVEGGFKGLQQINTANKAQKNAIKCRIQEVTANGTCKLYFSTGPKKGTIQPFCLVEIIYGMKKQNWVVVNITTLLDYFVFKDAAPKGSRTSVSVNQLQSIEDLKKYCTKFAKTKQTYTIADLTLICLQQIQKGHANREIYLAGDDEGNTFYGMENGILDDEKEIRSWRQVSYGLPATNDIVILG